MESIKVCCRFRPQNSIEKEKKATDCIQVSEDGGSCGIGPVGETPWPLMTKFQNNEPIKFSFDRCFGVDSTQNEVFEYAAKHLVDQVFEGYNATIFAFGQTGAGKTFSMEGQLGSPHRGIVPRTVETIFEKIAEADNLWEFVLKISYVEIYLEDLRDLLNPNNGDMKIRESQHGVYIEGVTEMYVRDAQEVMDLMTMGANNRTVSSTNMNAVSSRSHGVFMLKLISKHTQTGTTKSSKLLMVDLAGSEKVGKTGATGQVLKEAQKINQSLSALGNVMKKLSDGKGHVPYRDSVLTRLLSDSLGGNCKTTLLIACSCSTYNVDETINTLRFGVRAKAIKNAAKINAEKTVAEYKKELAGAQEQLLKFKKLNAAYKHDLQLAKKGQLKDGEQGLVEQLLGGQKVDLPKDEESNNNNPKISQILSQAPLLNNDNNGNWDVEKQKALEDSNVLNEQLHKQLLEMQERLEAEVQLRTQLLEEVQLIAKKENRSNDDDDKDEQDHDSDNDYKQEQKQDHNINMENDVYKHEHEQEQDHDSDNMENVQLSDDEKKNVELNFVEEKASFEEENVLKLPENIGDLSPELLEEARRGLQHEIKSLKEQVTRLNNENRKIREQMLIKSEELSKQKDKTDEAEMECAKILLEKTLSEERNKSVRQEKDTLERENQDLQKNLSQNQIEIQKYKEKIELIQKEAQKKIQEIQQQSQDRAENFIKEAQEQIRKAKERDRLRNNDDNNYDNYDNKNNIGKANDFMRGKMKENNRKVIAYEQKMKNFEKETLEQLQEIQLEQMKLKQALSNKEDENDILNNKIHEQEDEINVLLSQMKEKDKTIKRQHRELKEFGELKMRTDQIHLQQYEEDQKLIQKLKKQTEKLKERTRNNLMQMFDNNNNNNNYNNNIIASAAANLSNGNLMNPNLQHISNLSTAQVLSPMQQPVNTNNLSMLQSNITSVIEWKKRQNVMVPLRGGGSNKSKNNNEMIPLQLPQSQQQPQQQQQQQQQPHIPQQSLHMISPNGNINNIAPIHHPMASISKFNVNNVNNGNNVISPLPFTNMNHNHNFNNMSQRAFNNNDPYSQIHSRQSSQLSQYHNHNNSQISMNNNNNNNNMNNNISQSRHGRIVSNVSAASNSSYVWPNAMN